VHRNEQKYGNADPSIPQHEVTLKGKRGAEQFMYVPKAGTSGAIRLEDEVYEPGEIQISDPAAEQGEGKKTQGRSMAEYREKVHAARGIDDAYDMAERDVKKHGIESVSQATLVVAHAAAQANVREAKAFDAKWGGNEAAEFMAEAKASLGKIKSEWKSRTGESRVPSMASFKEVAQVEQGEDKTLSRAEFSNQIAKKMRGLKKLGASTIKQTYKGTGSGEGKRIYHTYWGDTSLSISIEQDRRGSGEWLISLSEARTDAKPPARIPFEATPAATYEKLHSVLKDWRAQVGAKKSMDPIDALDALSKGFPPGKPTTANDDPSSKKPDFGAKQQAPQGAAGDKPEPPAKPGEGQAGAAAQPGLDPDKGSIQYPTKIKNPETGEFEFIYLDEADRDPDARFVVSDETAEGAHWENPQHSEHYDAFKQWKAARKKGLQGSQIPHELVQGAVKHAEKHHFDGGPHKAAFDDYLAHQGENEAPTAPPTHHSVKNGNGPNQSHPAMRGQEGDDKNGKGAQPPQKPGQGDKPAGGPQGAAKDKGKEKDLIGKLAQFAQPHDPSQHDIAGAVPSGRSRSGTEYSTAGAQAQQDEDAYQELYGNLQRSMDPIDALDGLAKAKYISRKRGADGKWKYTYPKSKGGGAGKKKKPGSSRKGAGVKVDMKGPHGAEGSITGPDGNEWKWEHIKDEGVTDFWRDKPGTGGREIIWGADSLDSSELADLHNRVNEVYPIYPDTEKSEAGTHFRGDGYDSLRKGLWSFDLSNRAATGTVPDSLLYDYLCAFIEEAHEHEKREVEHRQPTAGEDFYENFARPVMHELVQYIPKNSNLARAAKKYKVTTDVIAEIMKKKGMIKPPTDGHHDHGDYWSHDWDSITAMGINERNGPTGEVLMASDARHMNVRPEPDAVRPLQLRKGPEMVRFNSPGHDLTGLVQRASHANIFTRYGGRQMVKANFDPKCLLHGDLHKQQISHGATAAKCSCPR
jgi:hypothetical protein